MATATEKLWDGAFSACGGVMYELTHPTPIGIIVNTILWIVFVLLIIALAVASDSNHSGPSFVCFNTGGDCTGLPYVFGALLGLVISSAILASALLLTPLTFAADIGSQMFSGSVSEPAVPAADVRSQMINRHVSEPAVDQYQAAADTFYEGVQTDIDKSLQDKAEPASFLCPIVYDEMKDPVLVYSVSEGDGKMAAHAYEREAIEAWRRTSNTCTLTRGNIVKVEPAPKLLKMMEDYKTEKQCLAAVAKPAEGSTPREGSAPSAQVVGLGANPSTHFGASAANAERASRCDNSVTSTMLVPSAPLLAA